MGRKQKKINENKESERLKNTVQVRLYPTHDQIRLLQLVPFWSPLALAMGYVAIKRTEKMTAPPGWVQSSPFRYLHFLTFL